MTAAGVQNLETAYLSPPPSSPSTPDTKAAGAAGTDGNQANFQNELEMQDTGRRETRPAGQLKTGSGKPGKKKDTAPEAPNAAMMTPVQVAEPQKQVLPLVLAVAAPGENAQANDAAKSVDPDEIVQPEEIAQSEKLVGTLPDRTPAPKSDFLIISSRSSASENALRTRESLKNGNFA